MTVWHIIAPPRKRWINMSGIGALLNLKIPTGFSSNQNSEIIRYLKPHSNIKPVFT
jgi:hypothetical protein